MILYILMLLCLVIHVFVCVFAAIHSINTYLVIVMLCNYSLCYQLEVAASIATTIDTLASGLRTLSEIYS